MRGLSADVMGKMRRCGYVITLNIDCDIKSTARLFADDCILYREINNASDAQIFQDDINKFQACNGPLFGK